MRLLTVIPLLISAAVASAQAPDQQSIERQEKEVSRLKMMDGHWRGEGWIILPTGQRQELIQTERVGPLLNGAIRVIEGRGYDADGKTRFNAFAVISYDMRAEKLMMRSYAQGRVGDFPIEVTKDGYAWEIPAGPATIRYSATIQDGTWTEVGERVVPKQKPMRFFEMKLKKIGKSEWPAAGKVEFK